MRRTLAELGEHRRAQVATSVLVLFNPSRTVKLDDGRTLVVMYGGERYGWSAYLGGPADVVSGRTPAEAIVKRLGLDPAAIPAWVRELSDSYERELREAPRFTCDCCGNRTLLRKAHYEICAVCGWEDDYGVDPDQESGPNRISLSEARANFQRYGACDERSKDDARDPRPDEKP